MEVRPTAWICRGCGARNPIGRSACQECDARPARRGMLAQVLNPGAEVVHNHVYNFASEATVVTPQGLGRAYDALERWTGPDAPEPAPAPRRDFLRSFAMMGAGMLAWLGVLVTASVFAFFVGVIWVALTR